MRHVTALIIKTIMVSAVLFVILNLIYGYPSVVSTYILAIVVVGASYLIGDMFILPQTNNTVATLADIGLNTLTIWALGSFFVGDFFGIGELIPFSIALASGVVIGIGEWFLHKYVAQSVLGQTEA